MTNTRIRDLVSGGFKTAQCASRRRWHRASALSIWRLADRTKVLCHITGSFETASSGRVRLLAIGTLLAVLVPAGMTLAHRCARSRRACAATSGPAGAGPDRSARPRDAPRHAPRIHAHVSRRQPRSRISATSIPVWRARQPSNWRANSTWSSTGVCPRGSTRLTTSATPQRGPSRIRSNPTKTSSVRSARRRDNSSWSSSVCAEARRRRYGCSRAGRSTRSPTSTTRSISFQSTRTCRGS